MSVGINLLANFLGQGWAGLMTIVFVPVYIKYLGVEAYGAIGVYAVMQAWFSLLDMGMSPTLNREMARFSAGAYTAESIWTLLRSLEVVCYVVAMAIAASVWAVSTGLAENWLRPERLSTETLAQGICAMGILVALRFIEGLYRAAILGLQKQVWFNVANAFLATLRAGGAVGILAWVSPTLQAYFFWQIVVSILAVIVFALTVRRAIPLPGRFTRFSSRSLAEVWKFARGMTAITALSLVLTQVDKILLSRLLNLETFGYYTLASTIASALYLCVTPITQAFYPRLIQLVTINDLPGLVSTYHLGAQLISILAVPAALVLILFGGNFLLLWTGDPGLSGNTAPLLALLALGTLLNAFMHMPYMLQLAHGWSGFVARFNAVAVVLLVPAILWATPRYGAIGAAWIWVILNACYILFAVHFVHRRLLAGEKWVWYKSDLLKPAMASLAIGILLSLLTPQKMSRSLGGAWLLSSGSLMVCVAIAFSPRAINFIFSEIRTLKIGRWK